VTSLDQRTVLAVDDGSCGPLLRIADDRLPAGAAYGRHAHRAVDVVAVVLTGSLRHGWGDGALVSTGDVAVLRAGTGLDHDETAGDDGVRVLQCYLRSAAPGAPPSHEVRPAASGWVDLRRSDARLWLARAAAGETVTLPTGLLLVAGEASVVVHPDPPSAFEADGTATLVVWQLDVARPSWADD
jgi:quercetin 2,3-dioxygenase